MGTESTTLPKPTDEKPQNPGSELVKPMDRNGQDAQGEATKEILDKSVFVYSESMREEQVQNAVKFLSHPKVRGSPVVYRCSFLEKKGLTKEEIDEAFRRVPDPPPAVTSVQPATSNQDGELKSTNLQAQVPTQTPQPAAAAPTGVVSTVVTLSQSRFHWSHAFLAIGSLAASGAGSALLFKNAVVPRLKSWIRKVVLEEDGDSAKKSNARPSLAEEAAAAAKAAAAVAADVAKASQEMLNSKNEEKYFEAFKILLDFQVEEMKSMSTAIRKLDATQEVAFPSNKWTEPFQSASWSGPSYTPWRNPPVDQEGSRGSLTSSKIMAMVQRREKPPGIREINDLPPNPNQLPSNPCVAPRIKPWEISQTQNSSNYGLQSQPSGEGFNYKEQNNRPASQLNDYSSESWWQRKNVRITGTASDDEPRTASYGVVGMTNERPAQRAWVPPQLPPISMPEAATAIRQPKSLIQKEQSSDGQKMACSSDGIGELDRVTKLSETGEVEIDNKSLGMNLNNIQEQENVIEGN